MHVEQLTYGALTPSLSFAMSYLGCLLGLMCATRARLYSGIGRTAWMIAAALSLGGPGIWVMHFVAMLGFSLPGMQVRYNLPVTGLSAVIAIAAVGAGLACVGDQPRPWRLVAGGVLTGLGVVGMHYLGMAAMVVPATMSYQPLLVAASVVIAVIASTVALWFTLVIRSRLTSVVAALAMAIAVCGMHWTGMAAVRMHASPHAMTGGTAVSDFLLPLGLVVGSLTVALCLLVPFAVSPADVRADAELEDRIAAARRSGPPTEPTGEPLLTQLPLKSPSAGRSSTASAFGRRLRDTHDR
ncbi:MAG: MHYT domain-containing protein [Actinocatenispora sp.]